MDQTLFVVVDLLGTIAFGISGAAAAKEGPGGMYDVCEQLAKAELHTLMARLRATPEVPVARHFDGPRVHEHIEMLLRARTEWNSR